MAVQRTLIGNIKGPKGDKGDTGDTGARGAGATVTIGSVTTTAYGGNASVTNSGTETDAVLDFVIPQGAPGETVTDMQNLTLSSMTEPSVQFPTPSVGDNGKTLFGKITKWFSDMAALVATKLNVANVVNNLTTTASGYALDARQGKVLDDTKLNIANVVNNLTTTASGYALDARQGKVLDDALTNAALIASNSYIGRSMLTARNDQLTFANGTATKDISSIYRGSEAFGFFFFPYNANVVGVMHIIVNNGVATFDSEGTNISGTRYVNWLILLPRIST